MLGRSDLACRPIEHAFIVDEFAFCVIIRAKTPRLRVRSCAAHGGQMLVEHACLFRRQALRALPGRSHGQT